MTETHAHGVLPRQPFAAGLVTVLRPPLSGLARAATCSQLCVPSAHCTSCYSHTNLVLLPVAAVRYCHCYHRYREAEPVVADIAPKWVVRRVLDGQAGSWVSSL